ncbi:hypothetical protein M9H77_32039 [Catharanthus roseus]|uniref:Uncharacterized protein n=1 Tax=Catharanthus roseus TaxID=4058 RepID=A0ACC0A1T2_CATRO|nr:hypothetical protein M9H77_32039 [Catharanthus roseus]
MTKMRHTWEVKIDDLMRDLLGDAGAERKRPVWIPQMFWDQMMKYWESRTGMRDRGSGSEEAYRWLYLLHRASVEEDLTKWFSKNRHLEDLHKHQIRDKKGQHVDFQSEEF